MAANTAATVPLCDWRLAETNSEIMIVGITLFFRLAQIVCRPGDKVRHPCPHCGQERHERDAVHCKACGLMLKIPHDDD